MNKSVKINLTDGIARVTMAMPDNGNAFDLDMFRGIKDAVDYYASHDKVRVIVITGEGKNFSVGGDISKMAGFDFLTKELMNAAKETVKSIRKSPKPVVAVINGAAAGAGMSLALACDYRVMGSGSRLVTAFSNMALSGDTGCMYFLKQYLGAAKAFELMTLSMPIGAEKAKELGLATVTTEDASPDSAAETFIGRLYKRPLGTFARQKKILNDMMDDFDAYCAEEAAMMLESAESSEHHEAVTAFIEKRKPDFL